MPSKRKVEVVLSGSMTQAQALELEKRLNAKLDLDSVFLEVEKTVGNLSREQRQELEKEYIRFIVLKVYLEDYDAKLLSPAPLIDEVWHAHLLHPKDYHDMCTKLCDAELIDHNPAGSRDGGRDQRFGFTRGSYTVMWPGKQKGRWVWESDGGLLRSIHAEESPSPNIDSPVRAPILMPKKPKTVAANTMEVYINTLSGKIIVEVAPHDTVYHLKTLIMKELGGEADEHRLIYAGQQLESERTLMDYNIQKQARMFVVPKLRGC